VLATSSIDGTADASPRGGPPGFVTVLDEHRLAWADYRGNRRADSHANVLERPGVGLVFFLPGLGETLRVNGRATLVRDPELLAALPTGGATPTLAFGVTVDTVYLHCAKAFRRSGLWDPSTWPDELPSPARILRDHRQAPVPEEAIAADLEEAYRKRLW
jgi:PPOX class probable FMN-dependent enzyme